MEDIYDDLNNYEDVNAVQELRNENKELKVKLEEHAAAMQKLQKQILQDYDTLEMEFRKLENNYSSLLKTARSEIERKTQRISQLNMEKDMMVLEALKNGKNIRRKFNKGIQNQSKISNEKPNKGVETKNKESDIKQKNVRNERCETTAKQTKELIIDANNRNKFENVSAKEELLKSRNSNVIHNKTELNDTPNIQASSIKNRRKSMPAASMPIDQFSSDEEHKQNYQTKDIRPDHPPQDKFDRRNINKFSMDRHSNKTSETSSIDDRGCNYYESSSRDNYKGRPGRNTESSSYRGRDKYEGSMKHRKQYSPDRGVKRQYRDHQDEYHRQERGRYKGRSLESPPPESYNRHPHRNPESRSTYDSRHFHDHEKYRYRHDDKYPAKSKSSMDYDEPHSKRQKVESFGMPDPHCKENRRYYHENEPMEVHCAPEFSPPEYDMVRYSCQSPDYVHTDATSTEPIEIKIATTTSTPLQDPRIKNDKYILKHENGKETISLAVGKNIDIKSIDKSKWNIKPVDIPRALVRRPSQCSDELVKDIYKDIDSPDMNLDLYRESGEVPETEDNIHVLKKIPHESKDSTIRKQESEVLSKQTTNPLKVSQHNVSKYRIPKVGQDKINTQSKMDVMIIDVGVCEPHITNIHNKGAIHNDIPKESIHSKDQNNRRDDLHHMNKHCKKTEGKIENQNEKAKIAIVADDLELSDDNSDHLDSNSQIIPEKIQKNCEAQLNVKEGRHEDSVHKTEKDSCKMSQSVDTVELKNVEEGKHKESDSNKKQKSKKKKSKSKEISKDSIESSDASHVAEKKVKSKKEKESKPKETKEKFSALFGDSSSLMTPEDLGIPSYVPISEDAQDAVDIKINQIIDSPPLLDNEFPGVIQKQNSMEITKEGTAIHVNKPTDVSRNCNIKDKEVFKEIKTKKSSKKKEELIDSNELPSPVFYENMNPGTESNEPPDVVKTVIISTGKQPKLMFGNREQLTATATTDVVGNTPQTTTHINQIPAITEFKKQDMLKALATSTPQKDFPTLNSIETDAGNTNIVPDTDKVAEQEVKGNDSNTLETQDAPDVRIFVKRRRKLAKRPPMT